MRERERERERGRERGREGERERVNVATVGNVIPKCSCQTGDSGVRVRFLRRWTKNIAITHHDDPRGARAYIFATTTLRRGRMANPTLHRLYPPEKP